MIFLRGFFLIIFIAMCYEFPLSNWAAFFTICVALYAFILNKVNSNKVLWVISIIVLIALNTSRFVTNSSQIEIGEQIYSPEDKIFNHFLPQKISAKAKDELNKINIQFPIPIADKISSNNPWAFSSDSFLRNAKMSKKQSYLDFNNRYDFRVGVLNNSKYNYYGKNLGASGAYYPLIFKFLIPDSYSKNKLCWSGRIFLKSEKYWIEKFSKNKECIYLKNYFNENGKNLIVFAFDFDKNHPLSIILKDNKHSLISLINILSSIIILLLLTRLNRNDFSLLALSSLAIILFLFDQHYRGGHPEAFSGFPYMGRGNDGLTHYSFARDITHYAANYNWTGWLKGGESVFYYMPGMRYIWSFSMFFFGESFFGILTLISLVPLAIRKILLEIVEKKMIMSLLLCFLIFPIFEAFGYFQLYLIKYSIEGFGAGLAIASLLGAIALIWKKNNTYKNYELFFIGILLFFSMSLRPNYGPTILVILLGFCFYFFYIQKKIRNFIPLALGFFPIILLPFHNYYFGSKIVLLTSSANIQNNMRNSPDIWLNCLDTSKLACESIINHISIWISYKEPWYIIIFFLLFLIAFNKKTKYFDRIIAIAALSGHTVFLFYEGVPRYSHGIWLISFLASIPYIEKNIWPKIKEYLKITPLNNKKNR